MGSLCSVVVVYKFFTITLVIKCLHSQRKLIPFKSFGTYMVLNDVFNPQGYGTVNNNFFFSE
jgi:hypothetical protein